MIKTDAVALVRKWLEAVDKRVSADWQTWTPAVTGASAMTVSAVSIAIAQYYILGPVCLYHFSITMTLGGIASGNVYVSAPPPPVLQTTPFLLTAVDLAEASFRDVLFSDTYPSVPRVFRCRAVIAGTNWNLGASKMVEGVGFYRMV